MNIPSWNTLHLEIHIYQQYKDYDQSVHHAHAVANPALTSYLPKQQLAGSAAYLPDAAHSAAAC